jgi:predicted transposase/invertase (TIGR01784 family)
MSNIDIIIVPDILPPSDDGVFKTLLTHPDAKPVLRDLVSGVLDMPIRQVEVKNVELYIGSVAEKQERFDVNCTTDSGEQVIVEMQAEAMEGDSLKGGHANIKSRAVYSVCDVHAKQDGRGIDYGDLLRSFQVTFCGYTVFPDKKFINRFYFRDEDGAPLSETVGVIFIELSKLDRLMLKPLEDMTPIEMWSAFFAYADKPKHRKVMQEIISRKGEIKLANDILLNISSDDRQRAHFHSRRMYQMDYDHDMSVRYKKGLNEGLAKGKAEGKAEIVRSMLARGMARDLVSEMTGLSSKEIENLMV